MYLFETQNLGVTRTEIHALRGGQATKKYNPDEILQLDIKYGLTTKYPIRLTIFGVCLIFIPLLVLIDSDFRFFVANPLGGDTFRSYGVYMVGQSFLCALGVYALYQSLAKKPVMTITSKNRDKDIFPLTNIKYGRIGYLIFCLTTIVSKDKLQIEHKVQERFVRV